MAEETEDPGPSVPPKVGAKRSILAEGVRSQADNKCRRGSTTRDSGCRCTPAGVNGELDKAVGNALPNNLELDAVDLAECSQRG